MNYITLAQLTADTLAMVPAVRKLNVDAIVGVPRSGMIPATILATELHLPLSDPYVFGLDRACFSGGERAPLQQAGGAKRVLLIDDSVGKGRSIGRAYQCIREMCPTVKVIRAAVYVLPRAAKAATIYNRIVPRPRVFQWNIAAHPDAKRWGFDWDGVLCVDPPARCEKNGELYGQHIDNAEPVMLPRLPIGAVISCRLDRWRERGLEWLRSHGVQAGRVIHHPAQTARTRRRMSDYGGWKGGWVRKLRLKLFVESDPGQAKRIAEVSGVPVLCWQTQEVIRG